jgi:hypothetical protein
MKEGSVVHLYGRNYEEEKLEGDDGEIEKSEKSNDEKNEKSVSLFTQFNTNYYGLDDKYLPQGQLLVFWATQAVKNREIYR